MLLNTFCHLPRIGLHRERRLWNEGIHTWDQFGADNTVVRHPVQVRTLTRHLEKSRQALEAHDAGYFSDLLPSGESWRLLSDFVGRTAYLDIETTGSQVGHGDVITTITLYDRHTIREYVHGRNLDTFVDDLNQFDLLVTYNGKCFDIPFIESYFNIKVRAPQVDLRFIFHSMGYTGGLKGVERTLGLDRGDLNGLDGYFAVLLWREYTETGNERALETLIAYNVADTVNLAELAAIAFNLKVATTPFANQIQMDVPKVTATTNFRPHAPTIEMLRRRYSLWR